MDDRDREALVALGEQVDAQLVAVDRHVDVLRRFLQSHSGWVNERAATAVADERFTSQRDLITRVLAVENDGYAERGIQFLDTLESLMPAERDELRGKLGGIREAGPVVTDLSVGAYCAISGAELAICLAYGPWMWTAAAMHAEGIAEHCT